VPVQQFISMGASGQPGAAPADGSTPAAAAQPQATPQPQPSLGGALGGALGGRFGLGKKKSQPADQPAQSSSQPPPSGSGSLLEMTTDLSSFSANAVDDSQFAVPSGFKKVEPDMKRGMR